MPSFESIPVFFFGHSLVRRISDSTAGIEAKPLTVEAWSPKHWTAREASITMSSLIFLQSISRIHLDLSFPNVRTLAQSLQAYLLYGLIDFHAFSLFQSLQISLCKL